MRRADDGPYRDVPRRSTITTNTTNVARSGIGVRQRRADEAGHGFAALTARNTGNA